MFGQQTATAPKASSQAGVGPGNSYAAEVAIESAFIQSGYRLLVKKAKALNDPTARKETLDAISNPETCIAHRAGLSEHDKEAIVQKLVSAGLADRAEEGKFPGGLRAGIFPPVVDDGSACPHLPQRFVAAPGGNFGGHHSYPGGLVIHELNNELSAIRLAQQYRAVYLHVKRGKFTVAERDSSNEVSVGMSALINQDLVAGPPLWHDWAKTIVLQWNADGSEFQELNFGGSTCDVPGNSCTGAHHILGVAETMKRGMSPAFVITQASAHALPTGVNEPKVVNWLRAAAIIDGIDPVQKGYLVRDSDGAYHLPPVPGSDSRFRIEYGIDNLSDADYVVSNPSAATVDGVLRRVAPKLGFDPADKSRYNNGYRNWVLSVSSAERLFLLYTNGGDEAILRSIRILYQCQPVSAAQGQEPSVKCNPLPTNK